MRTQRSIQIEIYTINECKLSERATFFYGKDIFSVDIHVHFAMVDHIEIVTFFALKISKLC
jgi:hypothetical protein